MTALAAFLIATDAAISGATRLNTGGLLFRIALGLVAVGALLWLGLTVNAAARYLEDQHPPLNLEHNSDDPNCVQRNADGAIQLRVVVQNRGKVGIRRVRVNMSVRGAHSHFLQIRHDNWYQKSEFGEDVATGDSVYFDVAFLPREHGVVFLCYADSSLRELTAKPIITPGLFIDLNASGWRDDIRDVVPTMKAFHLSMDGAGHLVLVEAST
jgi:hypothetical protein